MQNKMKTHDKARLWSHLAGYVLIAVFITIGFFIAPKGQEAFLEYLKEDGLVENLTTLFLLGGSGVAVYRALQSRRSGQRWAVVTWGVLAFLFFFAAGEEISWGQRIFNIETPGYFMEKNLQKETNLHNLMIGNIKVNKLIFSQLLTVALVFYLVFLRLLVKKSGFFHRLVTLTGVPLPSWDHVLVLLLSSVLISQYHLLKEGELRELAFSVVFFLIFLFPVRPGVRQGGDVISSGGKEN